ncbi:MAG TPA: metalloregulator ArsR/SmtB family transcription factor [Thermomicrobiaceae bacterium]|nr:metalloregulator ArsR/SmtB family transcription factor [Thermomicrobiaceae bacterium]
MPPTRPSLDTCDVSCIHPAAVAAAWARLLPVEDARAVARTFGVLADPTRVRLLHALVGQELCVCDLAAVLGMRQPAVSQQLRVLRAQGIVRVRKAGHIAYYALVDDTVVDLLARFVPVPVPVPVLVDRDDPDAATGVA